jgi:glycosyltransferase involved in cell wall biosynthesis
VLLSCASGEGFGLPYIEAMATKTAVCTLDVSVEEELLPMEYVFQDNYSDFYANYYVSSGQDGYPFPRYKVNHKRALAHRIDDILKEDLSEIKNTCYNEVKERFDWSREVDKLVNLFKK